MLLGLVNLIYLQWVGVYIHRWWRIIQKVQEWHIRLKAETCLVILNKRVRQTHLVTDQMFKVTKEKYLKGL